MPSVRFSRDKRGYEYVYLVHTSVKRGKPGRSRVLYWYRTPPGVRVGRKPFDEEVQRTLERQNPGVTFDWETIIGTPMPPPDMTEFWRERRRQERAARQERRAEEAATEQTSGAEASVGMEPDDQRTADEEMPGGEADLQLLDGQAENPGGGTEDPPSSSAPGSGEPPRPEGAGSRRRRRRRGGRRGPGPDVVDASRSNEPTS